MKKNIENNFTKLTQKKGISLIVLIVTIIVIIILAAAVILTITKNNPVDSAKEAKFKEDVKAFQDDLALTVAKEYTDKQGQRDQKISTSDYNEIKKYIPSFTEKYKGKFIIQDDQLVATDKLIDKEKEWVNDVNINSVESEETNYTSEEIENSEYLYAIGKTKPEYVVAKFNDDYSEVVITKNGEDSDGIVADFAPWMASSPMSDKKDTLNKVVVKEGIVNLGCGSGGSGTFKDCTNLKKVALPKSLKNIGDNCFYNCSSLSDIVIPDSVATINSYSFYGCSSITSIIIPSKLVSIGNGSFLNCIGLTNVIISDGVTSIGASCFAGCSGLTSVNIPNSVNNIDSCAFCECSSLIDINIPSSVIRIGDRAFDGTIWYENKEDGIIYINDVLYKYKGNMQPNTSIVVKDGIKSISRFSFENCSNLSSIIIPDSVINIGTQPFNYCTNLSNITYKGTKTQWNNIDKEPYWNFSSKIKTITCTDGVITL